MVDVDKTMIENPQLRACIYANAPLPSDPDLRQQAEATAEMFVDVADLVFQFAIRDAAWDRRELD